MLYGRCLFKVQLHSEVLQSEHGGLSELVIVTNETDLTGIFILHSSRICIDVNRGLGKPSEAGGDGGLGGDLVVAHEAVRGTRSAVANIAGVTGGCFCRTAANKMQ